MAYDSLKTAIQSVIKTNGNKEITGALLQQSLLAMINSLDTGGYLYHGIAHPTDAAVTLDEKVFMLATEAGTYTNFDDIVVNEDEVVILKYNGTAWSKDVVNKVFVAEADVTPFADVLAAWNAGKQIFCKDDSDRYFVLAFADSENFSFSRVGGKVTDTWNLTSQDGWSVETHILAMAADLEAQAVTISQNTQTGAVTLQVGSQTPVVLEQNVIEGDVTNNPDEVDITTTDDNKLQFRDRPNTNGMGYKILRVEKTFAEQVTDEDTIYEIRYEFDLDGEDVEIPANCGLKFNGGKISNGTIVYSNTTLLGEVSIDCTCVGAVKNEYATPEMYGFSGGDLYSPLQSAINYNPFVIINAGTYTLGQTIRVPSNRKILGLGDVLIKSDIPAYDYATSPFKDGSIVNVAMFALRGIEDGADYSNFASISGDFLCGDGVALSNGTYKSNYVDVADASSFEDNDIILVSEGLGYWHYVTQEIAEISSISGNRIYLKNPLRYQYYSGEDSIGNFFKNVAPPAQPSGEQPILADFVACGIRKIIPVENVEIKNISLDTSTEGATSKLGLFVTLSRNVRFENVTMPKGRIWMTDSQDVVFNSCSTGETNSYAGNGSNHISYNDCLFTGGLQIEEGASDVAVNDCFILSTSVPFSIIAHCKNIIVSHCHIVGEYISNVAAVLTKCKNITFIGCSIHGGSTAFRYYGDSFLTAYPSETSYATNKELTEYYDSPISILSSYFVAATSQKSIINEHTSAKIDISSVYSRNGISGLYEGVFNATLSIEKIEASNSISINGGKNAITALLQTSAQLNPATYVVDGRGAWGGESNGSGAEVEGSKNWTAIGCRNGGANGKLMQNNYDFGIFHPSGTQKLYYREGTENTYHPVLSDNSGLSCTSSDRPTVSHRALGVCYFDTTLGKPIWWNGSAWVDSTGAAV